MFSDGIMSVPLSNRLAGPKAERSKKQKKKQKGTKKTACEKGTRGGNTRPLPSKRVPGVPVTLCQTQRSEKAPRNCKPVSKRARSTAPPGPHSGAGRVRRPGGTPRTTTGPPFLVGVKKAAKHNRRGKQKHQKETTKTPLPPRVQKKGLRRVPGESQKSVGPRMAPQGNTKQQDARPKKVSRQARWDNKRNKDKQHKVRLGVCPVTT